MRRHQIADEQETQEWDVTEHVTGMTAEFMAAREQRRTRSSGHDNKDKRRGAPRSATPVKDLVGAARQQRAIDAERRERVQGVADQMQDEIEMIIDAGDNARDAAEEHPTTPTKKMRVRRSDHNPGGRRRVYQVRKCRTTPRLWEPHYQD